MIIMVFGLRSFGPRFLLQFTFGTAKGHLIGGACSDFCGLPYDLVLYCILTSCTFCFCI